MRHVSFTCAAVLSLVAGSAFAGDYPIRFNDRPITMNGGMTQVDVQANNLKDAGDALSFGLAGHHSLSDQLQIDVLTDVLVKPEAKWSEELGVGMSYTVHKTDTLDVAPGVFVPLNLGDGDMINAVVINGAAQYGVNDTLAVTVGQGLISYFKLGDDSMSSANVNVLFGLQLGGAYRHHRIDGERGSSAPSAALSSAKQPRSGGVVSGSRIEGLTMAAGR